MRIRARAALAALAVAAASILILGTADSAATVGGVSTPGKGCHTVTAASFAKWSERVWDPSKWHRGAPKKSTRKAQRRKLKCAAGPGHAKAMKAKWRRDKRRYRRERNRCAGSFKLVGRVSYFGGGTTASGLIADSTPGLALNVAPGTEWGWNNSRADRWVLSRQKFRVTIAGHTATLPVIDKGPAGFTGRAIDVTTPGVIALGLSPSAFPTDSTGVAKLLPRGC
jgi:hypothetical protein